MMSCDQPPPNPRANVFIMVNLGCEMLFVIDQRLKAQQIASEKSIQVIHDVISVLLEPKFIDSLIVGSTVGGQLLTEEHCKFMLKDIATCSLMRLDDVSMDKLWNLMTMIYKWQLFHTKHQYQLIDITFRHLEATAQLYPDEKRSLLIDFTKNTLLDFWNMCTDADQYSIYTTNKVWLESFHVKISLLIRLGFQDLDGSFFALVDETYFNHFKECIGDNIYVKSAEIAQQRKHELDASCVTSTSANCVNQLAEMLNYSQPPVSNSAADESKPINDFQKQFEKNSQQCNILFEDLDVNVGNRNNVCSSSSQIDDGDGSGFIHLNPTYSRQNLEASPSTPSLHQPQLSNSSSSSQLLSTTNVINKELLELYSKLN